MRFRFWAATLVVAIAATTVLGATPAGAHAFLTSSNPDDGAVLTSAPSALRLDFSEAVVIEATHITITDSSAATFAPTSLRLVSGEDSEDPSHVVADLPALGRSAYRVSWQTLSSDDLHRTSGVLVFGVNAPVRSTPFAEPRPRIEESSLRWLVFLALAAALGGQLAIALLRRTGGDPSARLRRKCRRVSAVGAAGGALVAAGLLVDQVTVSGTSLGQLFSGEYGARWLTREIGFLLLLAAATGRLDRSAVRRTMVVLGALATCVGSALLGHSGSAPDSAVTRTAADAAHLGAAATWSGLLLIAALILLPRARGAEGASAAAPQVLRAFGIPAAICVSVMVATGVYLASGVVGSVDAALFTLYGRTLLLKVGIVAVAGLLGLVNTVRLHARPARPTPRRTVYAEAGLGVLVLALAAVLTSGQPAREPEFVATTAPSTSVPIVDAAVADLQESLAIRPNRPGRNVVLIGVFDTRRPVPAPIRRVLVAAAGADGRLRTPTAADRLTDGQWSVATDVASSGPTRFQVTVERPGLPATTHDYTWTVGGAPVHTRQAVVSTAPVAGLLKTIAATLTVLLLVAWAVAMAARIGRRGGGRRPRLEPDSELPEPAPDLAGVR
jgi:copper transport protein